MANTFGKGVPFAVTRLSGQPVGADEEVFAIAIEGCTISVEQSPDGLRVLIVRADPPHALAVLPAVTNTIGIVKVEP